MIIACPACATRYVVPDTAIGIEGRTVRCAKCRHSWFQDGPELAGAADSPASRDAQANDAPAPAMAPPPPTTAAPQVDDPLPQAPEPDLPAPSLSGEGGTGAATTATPPPIPVAAFDNAGAQGWSDAAVPDESGYGDDEASQFDHAPPFRPRRNWLRWFTWGAGIFAALALAAVVAMSMLGLPSWLPGEKPLFGSDPGLKVEFPANEQERRTLPNGAEFFGARVVITNETRETKTVSPLLIVLRDSRERVVYSWELVPPQKTLAPGEAMTINEAMTDVPKSAVYADIGWAPR